MVALGACAFTLCGQFAFEYSTMAWDSSRVSAAIPSGVGFLGAGLIWKGLSGEEGHFEVRGLNTAASVWLSAATGMACGGHRFFLAILVGLTTVLALRYAPRTGAWLASSRPQRRDQDRVRKSGTGDGEEETEPLVESGSASAYGTIAAKKAAVRLREFASQKSRSNKASIRVAF